MATEIGMFIFHQRFKSIYYDKLFSYVSEDYYEGVFMKLNSVFAALKIKVAVDLFTY